MKTRFKTSTKSQKNSILTNSNFLNNQNYIINNNLKLKIYNYFIAKWIRFNNKKFNFNNLKNLKKYNNKYFLIWIFIWSILFYFFYLINFWGIIRYIPLTIISLWFIFLYLIAFYNTFFNKNIIKRYDIKKDNNIIKFQKK